MKPDNSMSFSIKFKANRKTFMLRLILLITLFLMSCQKAETQTKSFTPDETFSKYWYQGKAELTRYEVEQARYGELHKGEAVIIFVTEDFRQDRHVKLEDYNGDGKSKSLSILKMNFTNRFNTGIYTYSPMTSVFSPLDIAQFPHSLKVSTSVQEWCGHVYSQINLMKNSYRIQTHSYFEKEADEDYKIDAVWLEDELWTRIRINPETLPIGDIQMIPGSIYSRFVHKTMAAKKAIASKTEMASDHEHQGPIIRYQVEYPSEQRTFILNYKKNFPHEITSFEGIYKDGFGDKAKVLHTIGIKKNSLMLDYWNKNSAADSTYRRDLGFSD